MDDHMGIFIMWATCLPVQFLVLMAITVSAKVWPGLDFFSPLNLPQARPRYETYHGEEGRLTSTIRLLSNLGSKIFDKAVEKFNIWSTDSKPKPSYAPLNLMTLHAKSLPRGYPSDLDVAESNNRYRGVFVRPYRKPPRVNFNWWVPFCSDCYDDSNLLQYLSDDYTDPRVIYGSVAQVLYPKPTHNYVSSYRKNKPKKTEPKLPSKTTPKWITKPQEKWNPMPAVRVVYPQHPTSKTVDTMKQESSNLHPVIYRSAYKQRHENKPLSTFRPMLVSTSAMKIIKPPIIITTGKPTPKKSTFRQYYWRKLKIKPIRGSIKHTSSTLAGNHFFVNPTTSEPIAATANITNI